MNSLTWFIYGVDVITSIKVYALWMVAAACGSTIIAWIGALMTAKYGTEMKTFKARAKFSVSIISVAVCVGLFLQLIPAKDTMYKMAASEIGEMALDSGGMETLQNLKKFIDAKLKDAVNPEVQEEKSK